MASFFCVFILTVLAIYFNMNTFRCQLIKLTYSIEQHSHMSLATFPCCVLVEMEKLLTYAIEYVLGGNDKECPDLTDKQTLCHSMSYPNPQVRYQSLKNSPVILTKVRTLATLQMILRHAIKITALAVQGLRHLPRLYHKEFSNILLWHAWFAAMLKPCQQVRHITIL